MVPVRGRLHQASQKPISTNQSKILNERGFLRRNFFKSAICLISLNVSSISNRHWYLLRICFRDEVKSLVRIYQRSLGVCLNTDGGWGGSGGTPNRSLEP